MTKRRLNPKANIYATCSKSEMVKRWQNEMKETRARAEEMLKAGNKKGYDKCMAIIENYDDAIRRENERIAMGIKQNIL